MTDLTSTQRRARKARLLYVLLALSGPIGLLYVPSQLIVPGDAGRGRAAGAIGPGLAARAPRGERTSRGEDRRPRRRRARSS
ncbi:MAG: hypothetical protein ABI647_25430 [Gemmatimonadota bacterium]